MYIAKSVPAGAQYSVKKKTARLALLDIKSLRKAGINTDQWSRREKGDWISIYLRM